MDHAVSPLWRHDPGDLPGEIARIIDRTGDQRSGRQPARVFFRADDVAVPGRRFRQLIDVFTRHRTPLALAVVPAWISPPRWRQLKTIAAPGDGLWCWHQHGWRHANHEPAGKKQEFGDSRPVDDIRDDLLNGRDRLASVMGAAFSPVFTPPWNRCGERALGCLKDLDYAAVSRSLGSRPRAGKTLPEVNVHVDLHTRKGTAPARDRRQLMTEIESALAGGSCGFMIHHQRMNGNALSFLDALLTSLKRSRHIRVAGLDEVAAAAAGDETV